MVDGQFYTLYFTGEYITQEQDLQWVGNGVGYLLIKQTAAVDVSIFISTV